MTLVLAMHVLQLLPRVTQNDNCGCDLLSQFVELLVSLLYLLIECLVLNLQLLEINEM